MSPFFSTCVQNLLCNFQTVKDSVKRFGFPETTLNSASLPRYMFVHPSYGFWDIGKTRGKSRLFPFKKAFFLLLFLNSLWRFEVRYRVNDCIMLLWLSLRRHLKSFIQFWRIVLEPELKMYRRKLPGVFWVTFNSRSQFTTGFQTWKILPVAFLLEYPVYIARQFSTVG
jgi:hypothetical protein